MELHSYTWFIYVLTLLLVMAIMLIFVLVTFKCLQTCTSLSIICMRKHRRQHVQRSSSNASNYSCSSDYSSADSDTSNNYNSTRFGHHPDRQLHQSVHENLAFTPDLDYSLRIANDQVINRKFDDLSRYCQKNKEDDPVKIVKKVNTISDFVDQNFQKNFLNQLDPFLRGVEKGGGVCNSLNATFRAAQLDNSSFNESYSIVGNDEIPPAYEQVVKESTV